MRAWRDVRLDEPTRTLLEFAERTTREPNCIAANDIQALRGLGLSDGAIHDAAQVIGYFNYINRVADSLGVEPDEWLMEFEKELRLTRAMVLKD